VKLTTEGPHNAVSKEKSSEALLAHPVAYAKLPLLWQQPDNNRDVSVLGAILPTCGVKRKRFSGRCYLNLQKCALQAAKAPSQPREHSPRLQRRTSEAQPASHADA